MIQSLDPLSEIRYLREENQKKELQIQDQNLQIKKLQHQIEQMLRNVFGKKSERFIPEQPELALEIKPILEPEVQKETITYERKKSNSIALTNILIKAKLR